MRNPLIAAAWLNLTMALVMASFFAVPIMAPLIAADLGVETTLLGSYQAILWGVSVITSIGAGYLLARLGAVRVAQLCLLLCALGLAAGSAGALPLLAVSAALIGLGLGAETPASSYLLARITPPPAQPLIFSFKQTGMQVGGVLAGFVYPLLVPLAGWRGAMLAMMALALIAMFALEAPRRRFDAPHAARTAAAGRSIWQAIAFVYGDPVLLRLGIASFAFVTTQVAINAFLVSYLVGEVGHSLALAGTMVAVVQAGGLIGRLGWGALSGRVIGARGLLAALGIGIAACAISIAAFGASAPVGALAALLFLAGLTANGWNGVFLAEVARLSPREEVGRITGAIFIIGTAGLMLGPLAFSAIASQTGFGRAYGVVGVFAAVGVVALLAPARRRRPAPPL